MEAIQGADSVTYTGSFGSRTLPATDWVVSTWNYTARAGSVMGGKTTITTTAMTGLPGSGSPVAGGWSRVRESEYDGAGRPVRKKNEIGREDF